MEREAKRVVNMTEDKLHKQIDKVIDFLVEKKIVHELGGTAKKNLKSRLYSVLCEYSLYKLEIYIKLMKENEV